VTHSNYNKTIFRETARWAIVDWLRPESIFGPWKEPLQAFMKIRHDLIRAQLLEWAAKDPSIRSYGQTPSLKASAKKGARAYQQQQPAGMSLDLIAEFDGRLASWATGGNKLNAA
jgi:hypothetical protein